MNKNENSLTAEERKWQKQFQDLVGYLNHTNRRTETDLATKIAEANGFDIDPVYRTNVLDVAEVTTLLKNYYCSAYDGLHELSCDELQTIGIEQQTIVYIQIIADSLKIPYNEWNC